MMTNNGIYFAIEEYNNEECLVKYTLQSWDYGQAPVYKKEIVISKLMFISMYKLWIEGSDEDVKKQQWN